jgi:hypothetical protein
VGAEHGTRPILWRLPIGDHTSPFDNSKMECPPASKTERKDCEHCCESRRRAGDKASTIMISWWCVFVGVNAGPLRAPASVEERWNRTPFKLMIFRTLAFQTGTCRGGEG